MEIMNEKGYFDFRLLIQNNPASIFYIVGQGGVGKSYSVKRFMIENFLQKEERFIFVKQAMVDLKASNIETTFDDVIQEKAVQEAFFDKYGIEGRYFVSPYRKNWCIFVDTGEEKCTNLDMFGKCVAISEAQRFKGGTYKGYTWVFYDEFISDHGYNGGEKEPDYLEKITGTVGRKDNPLKIVFCGNPDSQIELCPYISRLHMDYHAIQENTPYFYDSIVIGEDGNRKTIGSNVCFLKLAHFGGKNFIHENISAVFGGKEGVMRATGERPDNEYMKADDDFLIKFYPAVNIITETPVYKDREDGNLYRVRIYAQVGSIDGTPAVYVTAHEKNLKNGDFPTVFSRWEENGYIYRKKYGIQVVKMRFPSGTKFFNSLINYLTIAENTSMIFTDNSKAATWFFDLWENGRKNDG